MTPPTKPRSPEEEERRRLLQVALLGSLVGKKVSLSTTDFHHVVGRLVELGPDDRLKLVVKSHEIYVRRAAIARIHEADPALAEYVK